MLACTVIHKKEILFLIKATPHANVYCCYRYLQTGKKSLEKVVFTKENQQRYVEFKKALNVIGFTTEVCQW